MEDILKKLLLALGLTILTLTGCGSSAASTEVVTELTEPVTITFWHAMNGAQEESLTALTDKFNEENDMITVELVNQGDYTTLQTKLTSAGTSNTLPTMAQTYTNWTYEYIQNGWVTDLSAYINDETVGMDVDNFVDAFINEVTAEDGSIWGVPFNKSTEVMYVNNELLGDHAIPTTFEELIETSKAIYEETGKPAIGFDSLSNFFAESVALCGDTSWVDENGEISFNNTCVADAVQTYQTGIDEGWARVAGEDGYLSGPFGNGDLAFNIGSTAGASFIESGVDGKFEYTTASYPASIVPQQGTNLTVFNTATPEEQFAAYTYIKYLVEDENTATWAVETGYLPVTEGAYDTETYTNYLASNPAAQATVDQLDKMSVIVPVFGGSNEIYSVNVNDFMSAVLEAGADVQTELDKLTENAQIIYSDNN